MIGDPATGYKERDLVDGTIFAFFVFPPLNYRFLYVSVRERRHPQRCVSTTQYPRVFHVSRQLPVRGQCNRTPFFQLDQSEAQTVVHGTPGTLLL